MAAASYTTDLATHTLCDTVTGFTEATGFTATDGSGVADTDLAIYGTTCVSESQRKSGSGSLFYTGTARTLPVDGAFFVWFKFFAPNALGTKAAGGMQILIGNTDANFRQYYVNGSDTYSYGGWLNYAVDPRITPSTSTGTPNTTYAGVGIGCVLGIGISKGNCYTIDHIRYGRGELIITDGDLGNGYATFAGAAVINDNPTTGRWGLLQDVGGSYLQKGLLTLGTVATAVDFRDSGVAITIDNTEFVSSAFNRIEVNNAASNVELSTVSITSISTVAPGEFEAIDNATIVIDGCSFSNMASFIFQTNSTITGSTFQSITTVNTGGCTISGTTLSDITNIGLTSDLVSCTVSNSDQLDLTVSGAALTGTTINSTLNATSQVLLNTTVGTVSDCVFENATADRHAVELTNVPASLTWDSAFAAGDYVAGPVGSGTYAGVANANATIYINPASPVSTPITINAANGTSPSVRKGANYTGTITVNLAANPTIDITVVDSAGSPIQNAWVYINDGLTTINNTQTNASGQITQIDYSGGQASSTIRVRIFGYYHYSATLTTSGNVNSTVTLIADAQQTAVPTLTDVWTDVPVSKTFGWTSGTNVETVRDVYQFLMNKYAAQAFMQYQSPMQSVTAREYRLINGWKFTNLTDYQKLKGGTIIDVANNQTWANVNSIGSIAAGSTIYVVQNDALITSWWPAGHIDILVEVRNSSGVWIQSTDDAQTAQDGGIWVFSRDYGNLYSSFFANLSGGGRTTIPISTSADINNTTLAATVGGYTITRTTSFATLSRSLNGTDFFDYRVEFDLGGLTLKQFYEHTKYITSLANSQTIDGDNGYEYRNAFETSFTGIDIQAAPFGTFAGGQFFGAQGVFITNMAASDNTNYELIDNTGVKRFPPLTATFSLTGLKDGSEVRLHASSASNGYAAGDQICGVEDMTGGVGTDINNGTYGTVAVTGSTNNNTFAFTYTYAVDTFFFAVILNDNYQYLKIPNLTLGNSSASIPVSQVTDRNYFNP